MLRIYKYQVKLYEALDNQVYRINVPGLSRLLDIGIQTNEREEDMLTFWFSVHVDSKTRECHIPLTVYPFQILGTGWEYLNPESFSIHKKTLQHEGLVWHVFVETEMVSE